MAKAVQFANKKLDYFMTSEDSVESTNIEYHPDLIDHRIIRELSNNGRASYTEIAETINVTPATVRNRMNRLTELGVIKNFKPLINRKLFNLDISALLFITLDSSKLANDIVQKLQEMPEITQISIMTNDPNIVCNSFAENMAVFSLLLAKITQLDGIKDVKSNFIIKSVATGSFIQ
ncbi:MAG: Lrp/AsnC family transcriptional regulator [Candidatus Helarchaeota archaeon]